MAVLYASINLIAAPPRATLARYHITRSELRLLDTAGIIPVIALWFFSLYGYQKLRDYSNLVRNGKDGKEVSELTRGVMLITFSFPVSSTLSVVLNLLTSQHPALLATTTIVVNYVSLAFALCAFWFISQGARHLSELVKQRPGQAGTHLMAIILIIAGVAYGYLIANARNDVYHIYHMPFILVLLTIVIPYIFSWYLGLLASYEILLYNNRVKGAIYRKGWRTMAFGVVWLIVFSVTLQYLTSVSARLSSLSLGTILALVYGILIIRVMGYIFVVLGSKRLTKIEEV